MALAIVLGMILSLTGYSQNAWPEALNDDPVSNGVRLSQLAAHPVRSALYWRTATGEANRSRRVGPAPPELIDFLRLDNTFQGYSERPVAGRDPELLRDIETAMESLPQVVRRITERRLFFIALVRDLGGGTGYMDAVADTAGSAVGGFIVLDEEALNRSANAWASWREGSAFRPDGQMRIEVRIETRENDNRVNAIRYILLHEIGHVIDVVIGATPIAGGNTRNIEGNGFYSLSWASPPPSRGYLLAGDLLRSRYDDVWPGRMALGLYTFDASAYDLNDAPGVYSWLRDTSFPTLYAASSPAEDFAESFVNYVHVVLDERPYEVLLFRDGQLQLLQGSCWESKACAPKRAAMKRLIHRAEILQ